MKLRIYIILIITLFTLKNQVYSQANTLIVGRMMDADLVKEISLQVDERYINGEIDKYTSKIIDDNTFAFAVEIKAAQKVKLEYSRNSVELYVEPFDTLYIESYAKSFPYKIAFAGRSGKNNEFLMYYNNEYPINPNVFQYTQYRKGLYWFNVAPDIDAMMTRMSKESFAHSMQLRKEKRLSYLEMHDANNKGELTSMFKDYITTQINYEYGYYMLCYGDIFKNKHGIERDFFKYLYDLPLDSNQIGNPFYREYVKAYLNHLYMDLNQDQVQGIYTGQYELAKTQLSGLSQSYFQSELISQALYGKKLDIIIDSYNDFVSYNTFYEFNDKITKAYQKIIKYHHGSPAPKFNLKTLEGDYVTLESLKGKPVFINFWASWCHPCMKKMKQIHEIDKELEEKGVVFLNISFDKTEKAWKNTIEKNEWRGVHVLLNDGVDSALAKNYNVRALPQYYLIDTNGNFAELPRTSDILELKQRLLNLLR